MAEDEYVRLMYFYRSFFKEIFGEAIYLMGRRGVLAVIRTAAKKFAENKIESYSVAQNSFKTAVKVLLALGKPEILDEETIIHLKKCPFKTRPSSEKVCLEEDVFCSICVGFINGICKVFNKTPFIRVETRIRRAKMCKFIPLGQTFTPSRRDTHFLGRQEDPVIKKEPEVQQEKPQPGIPRFPKFV